MFADSLRQAIAGICQLSEPQIGQLEGHYELLLRWNRVLNLTAVRNPAEILLRHYAESLFLAAHLPDETISIVDIGSGAGFPGIPVAVLRPAAQVTLVESHQRKAVFLREASRHIANVRVAPGRAEAQREVFDWSISRGVRAEDVLPLMRRLSRNAALLSGAEGPDPASGFQWQQPIRLPWGRQRFLWLGSNVSRET